MGQFFVLTNQSFPSQSGAFAPDWFFSVYLNGNRMTAAYNGIGQMTAEKWFNKDGNLTVHYKYVYDGQGNIVRSLDIKGNKEYNYLYEDGKIVQSTESDIVLNENDFVTSKAFV